MRPRFIKDLAIAALVGAVIFLGWGFEVDRLDLSAWASPPGISGDAAVTTAFVKAAAEGDFTPALPKFVTRLGAPFVADWNSWPVTEEFLVWGAGVGARLIGLFPALALILFLAHLLAGLSFFYVSRKLGFARLWSGLFATLFGLSYYIFARGVGHLTVGFCWHVPLCCLVFFYVVSERGVEKNRMRFATGVFVSVVTGLQNPYFTFVYVQFLLIASFIHSVRRRRLAVFFPGLALCGVSLLAFFSMQIDTLLDRWRGGSATPQVVRLYSDMELYALKPFDLIFPINWHLDLIQHRLAEYRVQRVISGEHPLSYVGAIAAFGCLLLALRCFQLCIIDRRCPPLLHKYVIPGLWVVALGSVGGVLGFAALLGHVYFFRAANRFSIFIIALLLLYLTETLTRLHRSKRPLQFLAATFILLIGFIDLPPNQTAATTKEAITNWRSVQNFVSTVESRAGKHAMIFVLPVLEFPEAPPRLNEGYYAPLALYIANSTLRFSYGDVKGHLRDTWQRSVESLSPAELLRSLESYGFAGVVIFHQAYPDSAAAMLAAFKKEGREIVKSDDGSLSFVSLAPAAVGSRVLPPTAGLSLGKGWLSTEVDSSGKSLLLSTGDSELHIESPCLETVPAYLTGTLESSGTRMLHVANNGERLFDLRLHATVPYRIDSYRIDLKPGKNNLSLRSDEPPVIAAGADQRPLTFGIRAMDVRRSVTVDCQPDTRPPNDVVEVRARNLPFTDQAQIATKSILSVADGSNNRWNEFRGPDTEPLLGMGDRPVRKIEFLPRQLPFAIAVSIKPTDVEPAHAEIVSCTIPDSSNSGFCFEHLGGNRYQFLLGTGKEFQILGTPVVLSANVRYLLTLLVSEGQLTVRLRGEGVDFSVDKQIDAESSLKSNVWFWGNWILRDRGFHGTIKLLALQESPFTAEDTAHLLEQSGARLF